MKLPAYLEKRVMRGLRIMAEAEKSGRRMSARTLGLELDLSETGGLETRKLLLEMGLLTVAKPPEGSQPVTRVSDKGWSALGETRPAAGTIKPPKMRHCLKCGEEFIPDGPMFRCDPCKRADEWQSGVAASFSGTRSRKGAAA